MDQGERRPADFVPRLSDLLVTTGRCWRVIREAQAEVDPCGPSHAALDGARTAIEALAHHLTGQHGFFALTEPLASLEPSPARRAR